MTDEARPDVEATKVGRFEQWTTSAVTAVRDVLDNDRTTAIVAVGTAAALAAAAAAAKAATAAAAAEARLVRLEQQVRALTDAVSALTDLQIYYSRKAREDELKHRQS